MQKKIFIASILNVALCIALGAFGAHYLKNILEAEKLSAFDTGLKYHIYHSLALSFLSMHSTLLSKPIAGSFLIGVLLFSGSLYCMTLLRITDNAIPFMVGIATPIGGIVLILTWIALAIRAHKTL
ncbi:MAG TPA: DUF423 domain-containing protein [Bacteroidia bacterium]|nr:DUF423 domain-containing protein [Bacteroidia bacterium]HNT79457.1 DUF423 domain-containing protein [Bacteroidia bacterium]